jgi:hypothetical protein
MISTKAAFAPCCRVVLSAVLVLGFCLAPPSRAEIGTIDDVPAATLLLPYFEVDLAHADGVNTLMSINNASQTAGVAHVTLWTDMSLPTFDFDIYLTGFDVQTINLRDLFEGRVPRTADAGSDPTDPGHFGFGGISPQGALSQDINYPGTTGPCDVPYAAGVNIPPAILDNLRRAHLGVEATIGGATACFGAPYGDGIARGYVTVDTVNTCNLSFPADAGYSTILTGQNMLYGDYFYVNASENFAQGETLVHIEACFPETQFSDSGYAGYVGNGAGYCDASGVFELGDYTFYGRYAATAGNDLREPLATTFVTRYADGGGFSGGTDLIVWRDSKAFPTGISGPFDCGQAPAWFPLNQARVLAFDEQEEVTEECDVDDIFSPPSDDSPTCFPLEAARYPIGSVSNPFAAAVTPVQPFGFVYLELNHSLAPAVGADPFPGVAQAWVTTVMDASGRFSVGFDAIQLDNALAPGSPIFD